MVLSIASTAVAQTTLQPSQSALPPSISPQGCSSSVSTPPTNSTACAWTVSNLTASIFHDCCGGNPVVLYDSECYLYCDTPTGQTIQQLTQCLANEAVNRNGSAVGLQCFGASSSSNGSTTTTGSATGTSSTASTTAKSAAGEGAIVSKGGVFVAMLGLLGLAIGSL